MPYKKATQVQLIKIFIINNAINQSFTLIFFFYRKEGSKSFTNSDTNNYLSLPFHANYLYPLYYFNLLICEALEQVMWGFEVQFLWYLLGLRSLGRACILLEIADLEVRHQ